MLWYKAWLETRLRFIFTLGFLILLATAPLWIDTPKTLWVLFQLVSTMLFCFSAFYLAGAGINTQTFYGATTGFHGSMLFTLSLPVSRKRLFLVRAGAGAVEMCVLIAIPLAIFFLLKPEATSISGATRYALRVFLCSMSIYALSCLLSCFLDEMWQVIGTSILLGLLWLMQSHSHLIAQLSPLRGMSLFSYPLSAPMPWLPLASSLVMTTVSFWMSVWVLGRKEY